MPEPTNAPDGSATATPSSPSVTPPGTPPPPEPWRAGPDAPEWARGKSPEEILALGNQMFGILQQYNQQTRTPEPRVAPAPVAQSLTDLPDDEYVSGKQVREYVTRLAQTAVDPRFQQAASLAASSTLAFVQQQRADDFKRWGPEIHGFIANLPPEQRTLDNLTNVVDFVRGKHLQELMAEQERTLRQQFQTEMVSPGLRSTGAPGAGPVPTPQDEASLANEAIPAEWRKRAQEAGITEQVVDEFLRANDGMTRKEFYGLLTKGGVMTDKAVVRG